MICGATMIGLNSGAPYEIGSTRAGGFENDHGYESGNAYAVVAPGETPVVYQKAPRPAKRRPLLGHSEDLRGKARSRSGQNPITNTNDGHPPRNNQDASNSWTNSQAVPRSSTTSTDNPDHPSLKRHLPLLQRPRTLDDRLPGSHPRDAPLQQPFSTTLLPTTSSPNGTPMASSIPRPFPAVWDTPYPEPTATQNGHHSEPKHPSIQNIQQPPTSQPPGDLPSFQPSNRMLRRLREDAYLQPRFLPPEGRHALQRKNALEGGSMTPWYRRCMGNLERPYQYVLSSRKLCPRIPLLRRILGRRPITAETTPLGLRNGRVRLPSKPRHLHISVHQ